MKSKKQMKNMMRSFYFIKKLKKIVFDKVAFNKI